VLAYLYIEEVPGSQETEWRAEESEPPLQKVDEFWVDKQGYEGCWEKLTRDIRYYEVLVTTCGYCKRTRTIWYVLETDEHGKPARGAYIRELGSSSASCSGVSEQKTGNTRTEPQTLIQSVAKPPDECGKGYPQQPGTFPDDD
jgi:hypothetical protein